MRWKIRLISIFIFVFVLSALAPTILRAQDDSITGVDILFIIDQSASMSGGEPGVATNDPLDLRFYATQFAAEWLGGDHLRVHDNADYRMAIIHFGSRAKAQNFASAGGSGHWQTIAPDSDEDWAPLSHELQNDLGPDGFNGHLGWTLPLLGFEKAKQLFDELPADSSRRRAIIVLTDGLPCDQPGCNNFYSGHFSELESFANENFPDSEYAIYTVAMNDSDQSYWQLSEPYWQSITGTPSRAVKVETNDDVGVLFRDILLELTSDIATDIRFTDTDIGPGEVVIPPYLESVEFTFFLSNSADLPQLKINGAEVNPDTADGVTRGGAGTPIQTIRVQDPEPGRWRVDVDPPDTHVNIVMRTINADGQLLKPTGSNPQYVSRQVQFQMVNSRGEPLRGYGDSRYDLEVTAVIESGDEIWEIADWEKLIDPDTDRVTYQASFTPLLVGSYTVHVLAESEDVEGNKIQVFDKPIGNGFTIEPVTFIAENIPSSGRQYEPFSTTYELVGSRNQRIMDDINLNATVTISSGSTDDEIELTRQSDGSYVAEYTPENSGLHTLDIRAEVIAEDGKTYTLADEESTRFDVSATRLLSVRIIPPEKTEQWNTQLWFQPIPLELEVEIVDNEGNRVDLNEAFVDSPATALDIDVREQKEGVAYPDVLKPLPASQGLYAAETTELGIGQYEITVQTNADLSEDFLFAKQKDAVTITRIRHPWHIPILIILIISMIVLILLFIAWRRYKRNLQVHPAVGDLRIINHYGNTRFRQRLDTFGRNRITFKEKELSNTVHVTKLEVRCDSEDAHDHKAIDVKVYLDGDKQPFVERTLRPGGEVKLGNYQLWLLKDPTDAQLDDRSE